MLTSQHVTAMMEMLETIRKARSRSFETEEEFQMSAFSDLDLIDISVGLLRTFAQIYLHPNVDVIDKKLLDTLNPLWLKLLTEVALLQFGTETDQLSIDSEFYNRYLVSETKMRAELFDKWSIVLEAFSKSSASGIGEATQSEFNIIIGSVMFHIISVLCHFRYVSHSHLVPSGEGICLSSDLIIP